MASLTIENYVKAIYQLAGSPENVILIGFKNPALRRFTGQTLAQVAAARGASPEDTMIDLVIEDNHRVDTAYVLMSEENIERNLRWPFTMIGSDAGSMAPEEPFTQFSPHPRAYGTFARFLGHYVRDRQLMPLEEGVRRLTSLPADFLAIRDRGRLRARGSELRLSDRPWSGAGAGPGRLARRVGR